jgi:hypothetical protein
MQMKPKLTELLSLCPFANKCDVSDYGDEEECIYDFEECRQFMIYEEEVRRRNEKDILSFL